MAMCPGLGNDQYSATCEDAKKWEQMCGISPCLGLLNGDLHTLIPDRQGKSVALLTRVTCADPSRHRVSRHAYMSPLP